MTRRIAPCVSPFAPCSSPRPWRRRLLLAGEVTKSQFSRLQIEGGSVCLLLAGGDNAIENNQFTGCRNAAADVFGDRNRVTLNRAEGNGTGFTISGAGNVVSRNVALRNDGDGFIISGEEATLDRTSPSTTAVKAF